MTNPYNAPDDHSNGKLSQSSARASRTALICNLSFLALFGLLLASVGYVLKTDGSGVRFIEICIFPTGVVAIAAYLVAMFYNSKTGGWVWALLISPVGVFLIFYMAMLIAGQF